MPAAISHDAIRTSLSGIVRGIALFLGGFTALNLAGEWRHPGFDATLWWIDVRWLPAWARLSLLMMAAVSLMGFAFAPPRNVFFRAILGGLLLCLMAISLGNAVAVVRLLARGAIHSSFPVPFSVLILAMLAMIAAAACFPVPRTSPRRSRWVGMAVGTAACAIIFPLGQMICFGSTDYRRPADLIVVFGCRVFADGTPSHALHDRVRTAAELYREGTARRLLLSGGPGDGQVHETAAMRKLALEFGVAPMDILLDTDGLNTEATVRHAVERSSQERRPRLLAVSHFYHLPRVKLCFHRHGSEVWTVPAREHYRLRGLTKFMAREIAALWWYYVAPVFAE